MEGGRPASLAAAAAEPGAGRLASLGGARQRWNPGGSGEEPQAQCAFAGAQAAVERGAAAASPGAGRSGVLPNFIVVSQISICDLKVTSFQCKLIM
ncbi:unnamed protein product [Coccothraustes coccothraustes]